MNATILTKVAGVTFYNTGANTENRQQIIAELLHNGILKKNTELDLKRVPDNPYDPNAVAVISPDGRQLGFLPRDVAKEVSPNIAKGVCYRAQIVNVVGGGAGSVYGIDLKISCDPTSDETSSSNTESEVNYYLCPKCGEMINDDDLVCPACGYNTSGIHPWVKSLDPDRSAGYWYSEKITYRCPFRHILHKDENSFGIPLRYGSPVVVNHNIRNGIEQSVAFFLYDSEETQSGLFRFSMETKRTIKISDNSQTVFSFDMKDECGIYISKWEQEGSLYCGVYSFEGVYPYKTHLLYKAPIAIVEKDQMSIHHPLVRFHNGIYYICNLPNFKSQNCFIQLRLMNNTSHAVIEEVPELSSIKIEEMIFLGDTLVYIDAAREKDSQDGKWKQGLYSFDFKSRDKSLLRRVVRCCNLSTYKNELYYTTENDEEALIWNILDEKKERIVRWKKCTDFAEAIFNGEYLVSAESFFIPYDEDEYRINFFDLRNKEVTEIVDAFEDLDELILSDSYLFLYSRQRRDFGFFDLTKVPSYNPIMVDGESILEYWNRLGKEELSFEINAWEEKERMRQEAEQKEKDELFWRNKLSAMHPFQIVVHGVPKNQYGLGEIIDCLRKNSIVLKIKFANGDTRYFDSGALGKTLFVYGDDSNKKLAELKKIIDEFSKNLM